MKGIICLFLGHKPYRPKGACDVYNFTLLEMECNTPKFGLEVVSINICIRCKKIYGEIKNEQINSTKNSKNQQRNRTSETNWAQ